MSRKAGTPNKPKVEITKEDVKNLLPPSGKDMLKESMPKYFILKSTDSKHLEEMVVNAIDCDCVPLGNVSVTNFRADTGSITYVYCQALVRKDMV